MNQHEVDQWQHRYRQLWNHGKHHDAVTQLLECQPDYRSLLFYFGKDQEKVMPYEMMLQHAKLVFPGLRRKCNFAVIHDKYIARCESRCLDVLAWTMIGGSKLAANECDIAAHDAKRFAEYAVDIVKRDPARAHELQATYIAFTELTEIESNTGANSRVS